ncbi:glyoxalase [Ornithinimicrobium murale]|uniref:glyoxalase n=1 Tax=Ornithinimicrobium murale TaxID=1050153 RepID=UPI000E0CCBF2|nr:glyoxalase [Ornithinimicrobium murale]
MASIDAITLEVQDVPSARRFYAECGLDTRIELWASDAPTSGFRGFTLSLTAPQPADINRLMDAASAAGAMVLKPAEKSLWGYGGAVQAPDGTIWTFASSTKKDIGPATGEIESFVLLLGVADVRASKQFYVDRGLAVARSFGGKYAEFDMPDSPVTLALNGRRALAKNAGVSAEGEGSHRLVVTGDPGPCTDPDGFIWEASGGADTTA